MKRRGKIGGMDAASDQSPLDRCINEGIEVLRELKRMSRPRLSAKAFTRAAIKIADATPKDVAAFEDRLNNTLGCEHAKRFVRQMTLAFRSNFPTPHADTGKMLRVYGDRETLADLLAVEGTPALAQAVAAKRAAERWPETFGKVEDWDKHQRRYAELRERLDGVYDQMRKAASALDFLYDDKGLLPSEKSRGLTRLVFRRAPGIPVDGDLATGDWARRLIEDCEKSVPAEPAKPKRRRTRTRLGENAQAA